jgi:hypothetical protein
VTNRKQCEEIFSSSCTYLYSSNDGNNGKCVEKGDDTLKCNNINRSDECEDGGGITSLNGKCALYETLRCEVKCSGIDENTCRDGRSGDCFWIVGNESILIESECVDKVCT